MGDLRLEGHSFSGVGDFVEVDAVLVGEGVEDVHVLDCVSSPLLVPVDEVDPVVDVVRNVATLQPLPESGHEAVGVAAGPGRQFHVVDAQLVLRSAVVVVIKVGEHLRQGVDFGDEFAEVGGGSGGVEPGTVEGVKDAVRAVELPALEGQCACTVGTDADEKVEDDGGGGVVRSEVILAEQFLLVVALVFL